MSSIDPFQPPLSTFPESYERTRIQSQQPPPVSSSLPPLTFPESYERTRTQSQQPPPVSSSPRPLTPPTPYWPSTPPIDLTPLLPYHDRTTRSPSLGPPPPTPPTPHDPSLDIDSPMPPYHDSRTRSPSAGPPPSTPPTPHDPRLDTDSPMAPYHDSIIRSPSAGPPPSTPPTPHDPWLDTHSETPTPPPRPRPRPRARRRRRRPQARPQAPPYLAPATPNIIDPMSMVYNPPSPEFEDFGNHYQERIAARSLDPSAKRDFTYRAIVESLTDVNKRVGMKRVLDALQIFDKAVEREEEIINRALGGYIRVMRRCHRSCAQATTKRDDRRIIQGLGRVWRRAVDDEIELEHWRGINRKRHWDAVRAILERKTKTLGWRMRTRRLKAKSRRAAKLKPVRRAGEGFRGERREARREGSLARGGDSGDEADDSWTDSSSGEPVEEQVEEQVEDEEFEDPTLGWAETYRLL